jgi:ribose transport system ATP-binding protein
MEDFVINNISKSFGAVKALVDVNFSADSGTIHALLGENGAGKSTLVKILSRAVKEDSGSIRLFGKQLFLKNPNDAINIGIGTVYQDLSLIPELTVAENLYFRQGSLNRLGIMYSNIINENTLNIFKKFEISGIKPNALVCELALSDRQIIEIVKVLSRNPKILILDEATSGLTEDRVGWLLKLLKRLSREGKIIIFISHRMQEVKTIADVVTVFRNGKNVGTRRMSETNSDELVSLMLGRKFIGYFSERESFANEEVILEVKNLSVNNVLRNVSFSLHKGEVLGIGGLVGQGQTPLFLSLFGIIKAKGKIFLNGREINIKNPRDSMDSGVALIPEDKSKEGLIMSMTLRENITMPILNNLKSYGLVNYSKEKEIVSNLMEMLRIKAESMESLVSSLSGGNQQKVVIAKLLSAGPEILLMFDPTRGVDIGTKVEIFNLIKKLAYKGKGIIYYSTTIDELVNICERVMVMHDGEIIETLSRKNLSKENILKASIGEKVGNLDA